MINKRFHVFLDIRLLAFTWLMLQLLITSSASYAAMDHMPLERVLKQYVDARGFVDYEALYQDRDEFDQYIASIGKRGPVTTPADFPSADAELAYYLNAYNALVINGVLSRGPEKKSVWSGLISGYNFFRFMKVTLDGSRTSLQTLEDEMIRARFRDPRIHAAINCASISCPRLRTEAFVAERLNEQLDASMTEFVNDDKHVRVNGNRVELSAIFDWFEEDFLEFPERKPLTVVDYINRYRNVPIPPNLKVSYLKYNKGINDQQSLAN